MACRGASMSERSLENSPVNQSLDGIPVYEVLFNYPKIVAKTPLRNLFDSTNPILYLIRTAFLDMFDEALSQAEWLRALLIVKEDMIEVGDIKERDPVLESFEARELSSLNAALDKLQELLEWSFFDLSQIEVLEAYVSHLNLQSLKRETAKGKGYKRLVTNCLSSTILEVQSNNYKLRKRLQTILGAEKKYVEGIPWGKIVGEFCYCDNKKHSRPCEEKFKKSWFEDVKPFLEQHDIFERLPMCFHQSKKKSPSK
jgi:hypothetical protein